MHPFSVAKCVTGQMLYWIMWEDVRRLGDQFKSWFYGLSCAFCIQIVFLGGVCASCVLNIWRMYMYMYMYIHAVILFVCDGAKSNRKFLKSLGRESEMKHGIVYKTVNRFCRERYIYFMSDVPHLIKTTRNCWYSSKSGGARYMWVCAQCYTILVYSVTMYIVAHVV